jgi:hypothetical protein
MCLNLLSKEHEIPFMSMEPPFVFDGWNNVAKYPVLNMMFDCCNGDVFLSVINMKDHNDAHYICNALVGYIKIDRMENIVQIFTNSVSNMQNVIDLLIRDFSGFYFQDCASHCSNLLLGDMGKEAWVK